MGICASTEQPAAAAAGSSTAATATAPNSNLEMLKPAPATAPATTGDAKPAAAPAATAPASAPATVNTAPVSDTKAPATTASASSGVSAEVLQLRAELAWSRHAYDELKNERLATAKSVLEQAIHMLQLHAETVEALKRNNKDVPSSRDVLSAELKTQSPKAGPAQPVTTAATAAGTAAGAAAAPKVLPVLLLDTKTADATNPTSAATATAAAPASPTATAGAGAGAGGSLSGLSLHEREIAIRQQLLDLLVSMSDTELSGQNRSFGKLIDKANIDSNTKLWLTREYTQNEPRESINKPATDGTTAPASATATKSGAGAGAGAAAGTGANADSNVSPKHGDGAMDSWPRGSPAEINPLTVDTAPATAGGGAVPFALVTNTGPRNSKEKLLELVIGLQDVDTWDFDITCHPMDTARAYAAKIFLHFDLLKRFHISAATLNAFLESVQAGYPTANTYHNFYHAVDVLHCVFMYLLRTDMVASAGLRSLDILSIFIAAICHDIDHPATNNVFQVQTATPLALRYNDVSVLEHHHAATAFGILTKPECNILSKLSTRHYTEARKMILGSILSTDMSHHFEMVAKLDALFHRIESNKKAAHAAALAQAQAAAAAAPPRSPRLSKVKVGVATPTGPATPRGTGGAMNKRSPSPITDSPAIDSKQVTITWPPASSSSGSKGTPEKAGAAAATSGEDSEDESAPLPVETELESRAWSLPSREDVRQLLNVLLHAADISNPAKPWLIAKKWADRVNAEFLNQGDMEKKARLPVSPWMDRANENQPMMSINFIDFIVAPLLASLVNAYPQLKSAAYAIIHNRSIWYEKCVARLTDTSVPAGTAAEEEKKKKDLSSLAARTQQFRTIFIRLPAPPASHPLHGHAHWATPPPTAAAATATAAAPAATTAPAVATTPVVTAVAAVTSTPSVSAAAATPPKVGAATGGNASTAPPLVLAPAAGAASAAADAASPRRGSLTKQQSEQLAKRRSSTPGLSANAQSGSTTLPVGTMAQRLMLSAAPGPVVSPAPAAVVSAAPGPVTSTVTATASGTDATNANPSANAAASQRWERRSQSQPFHGISKLVDVKEEGTTLPAGTTTTAASTATSGPVPTATSTAAPAPAPATTASSAPKS